MKGIVAIYNYQTLISGFLAVGGAAATVFIIHRQIRQANELETERRRRRNFAARAMMPAALSELSDYAQKCIGALHPLMLTEPNDWSIDNFKGSIPSIPDNAMLILRDSIEFAADPVSENIADLVRKLQIQYSRLRNIVGWLDQSDKIVVRHNMVEFTVDALEIYARCANLFPYARRTAETVATNPSQEEIISASRTCEIWELPRELSEMIGRRYDKAG